MGPMAYQSAAVRVLGPFPGIWPKPSGRRLVCPISGQTHIEEIANAATHGLGWLLSIAGLVVLVVWASLHGDPWLIVGSSIFGATLVLVYAASTIYHACPSVRFKPLLRTVDESLVYLLIAGTYTPFAFGPLFGGWGWSLFGITWGVAAVGIGLKILFAGRFRGAAIGGLLGHGVALRGGHSPTSAEYGVGGAGLVANRGVCLHLRGYLHALGQDALQSRRLAPGGFGRQRLPLFRYSVLRYP